MQNEIWKPIKGYEGLYEVSSLGNVKSLVSNGRILKPDVGTWGHKRVTLCKEKSHNRFLIHRLAFESFHGELDDDKVIDHIDSDPSNNIIANLQQVSQRENVGRGELCDKKKSKSSKYRGVTFRKNRGVWQAHIFHDGKLNFIGHYSTETAANMARQQKLKEITA